jgi:hypothetical protein
VLFQHKGLREGGRQACDHHVDLLVQDCHCSPPAKPVQRPEFQQTDAKASRKKASAGAAGPTQSWAQLGVVAAAVEAVDQHLVHAHLAHVAPGDFDGVGGHEAL